jgi:hypothetical protein
VGIEALMHLIFQPTFVTTVTVTPMLFLQLPPERIIQIYRLMLLVLKDTNHIQRRLILSCTMMSITIQNPTTTVMPTFLVNLFLTALSVANPPASCNYDDGDDSLVSASFNCYFSDSADTNVHDDSDSSLNGYEFYEEKRFPSGVDDVVHVGLANLCLA